MLGSDQDTTNLCWSQDMHNYHKKLSVLQTSDNLLVSMTFIWVRMENECATLNKSQYKINPKRIIIVYLEFMKFAAEAWRLNHTESCSSEELVQLNGLPNLIQKFDSHAMLLSCFCRASAVPLDRHGRSTKIEPGLIYLHNFVVRLRAKSSPQQDGHLPC